MKYGWQFSRADGNFKALTVNVVIFLARHFFWPESPQDVSAGNSTLNRN
jgi:hypothetical protein